MTREITFVLEPARQQTAQNQPTKAGAADLPRAGKALPAALDQNKYLSIPGLLSESHEAEIFDFLGRCKQALAQPRPEHETRAITNRFNAAKDVLLIKNESVVKAIVMKYASKACGLTLDELFSAGNDGLLKAMDRYRYRHQGSLFSAYARESIRWSIVDEIRRRFRASRQQFSLEQSFALMQQNESGDELQQAPLDTESEKRLSWGDKYAEIAGEIAANNYQTPEDLVVRSSTIALIRQAVSRLSATQKMVVEATLQFINGDLASDDAMFEATGLKKDNFYYHRRNAFSELRNELQQLAA